MTSKECILFYVKFPKQGSVKTRLARDIGDKHAFELYKCFVLDILEMLATLSQIVCVCYTPGNSEYTFRMWLGEDYLYFPQQGNDLGQRMENSFRQAFRYGFEKAVLIGSDLPGLPSHFLVKAFEQLHSFDSVIGPSDDGGYYLLGFRRDTFFPEVLQGMTWSQPSVYEETLKRFERRGVNFFILPAWDDIDNLQELQQWYNHNRSDNTRATRTITYLQYTKELKHMRDD